MHQGRAHAGIADVVPGRYDDAQLTLRPARHQVTATTFDTAAWLHYPSRTDLPQKVRAMIAFLRAHAVRDRLVGLARSV